MGDSSNATPPARRGRDLGVIAGATALGVLVFLGANWWLSGVGARALDGDWQGAMGQFQVVLALSSAALFASSLVLGILLRRTGQHTVREHHYPPAAVPGVDGLRERDGVAADRMGRHLRLAGLLVIVFGVAAAAAGFALAMRIG